MSDVLEPRLDALRASDHSCELVADDGLRDEGLAKDFALSRPSKTMRISVPRLLEQKTTMNITLGTLRR